MSKNIFGFADFLFDVVFEFVKGRESSTGRGRALELRSEDVR